MRQYRVIQFAAGAAESAHDVKMVKSLERQILPIANLRVPRLGVFTGLAEEFIGCGCADSGEHGGAV